jgi:hypothetical protein
VHQRLGVLYETVGEPLLHKTQGVVYVLPETRPARVVFGSFPVDGPEALRATAAAGLVPAAPTVQAPVAAAPAVAEPTKTLSNDGPPIAR